VAASCGASSWFVNSADGWLRTNTHPALFSCVLLFRQSEIEEESQRALLIASGV